MHKLTESQALIMVNIINKKPVPKRMNTLDAVMLTQIGAIKYVGGKLTVTNNGKRRFVKWARKEGITS